MLVATSGCAGITHKKEKPAKPQVKSRLKVKKSKRTEKLPPLKKEKRARSHHKKKRSRVADQESTDQTVPELDVELNTDYFKGFVTDSYQLVTSPLHWGPKDWLTAGLVAGGTVSLGFLLDEDLRQEVLENPSQARTDFLKVGEIFGDGGYAAGYLSLFYLTGLWRDNEEMQKTALLATESFLITGAFTLTLKHLIGRKRPSHTGVADDFEGPFTNNLSFPSGHTSTAFSIATIFAKQYKRHIWVPPLAYTLATMTALSRVNDNEHWASDVFFGAALGYFTASALYKIHNKPHAPRLMIRPMMSSSRQGIALDYQF